MNANRIAHNVLAAFFSRINWDFRFRFTLLLARFAILFTIEIVLMLRFDWLATGDLLLLTTEFDLDLSTEAESGGMRRDPSRSWTMACSLRGESSTIVIFGNLSSSLPLGLSSGNFMRIVYKDAAKLLPLSFVLLSVAAKLPLVWDVLLGASLIGCRRGESVCMTAWAARDPRRDFKLVEYDIVDGELWWTVMSLLSSSSSPKSAIIQQGHGWHREWVFTRTLTSSSVSSLDRSLRAGVALWPPSCSFSNSNDLFSVSRQIL